MPKPNVDQFLDALNHPQRELIDYLRAVIVATPLGLVEGVKWNAPSYALDQNDLVTFNFRNYQAVALIFHTGPHGKDTHTGVHPFETQGDEVVWLADKRFVVKFASLADAQQRREALEGLLRQWVALFKPGA